jgi:hypothetical protein
MIYFTLIIGLIGQPPLIIRNLDELTCRTEVAVAQHHMGVEIATCIKQLQEDLDESEK